MAMSLHTRPGLTDTLDDKQFPCWVFSVQKDSFNLVFEHTNIFLYCARIALGK